MLARWTSAIGVDDLQAVGLTPEGVMEQTRHNVSQSRANSDQIVDWFLELTTHDM